MKFEEWVEGVLQYLDEARRRIGLRQWRRMKQVKMLRSKKSPRPKHVRKMYRPWRKGAVHNRHR